MALSDALSRSLRLGSAILVLAALHSIHAFSLLLNLLLHLSSSLQSGSARLSSHSLESDARRWSKLKQPAHLGVVFVPAARGRFEWTRGRYIPWREEIVLEGFLDDLQALVQWCKRTTMESLILYDETGM